MSGLYDMDMSNWDDPIELDEDIELWEQQPSENDEHYSLFKMYLKLTPQADTDTREVLPRRISELFGKVDLSDRHIKRLGRRFCWETRARAHDLAKVQSVQGQLEHHWLVLVENRLKQLDKADQMIFKAMEAMLENPESYKFRDLVMFWAEAVKVGNGILGMTRLGGPDQSIPAQAMAGARAEVTVGGVDMLDRRTVELAEELQRRELQRRTELAAREPAAIEAEDYSPESASELS